MIISTPIKLDKWYFLMLIFLIVKIGLDFFTPFRESAFIISNVLLYGIIIIIFYINKKITIKKRHIYEFLLVLTFFTIQVLLNADIIMLIKLMSFYLSFRILSKIFFMLTPEKLEDLSKKIILIVSITFFSVFIMSVLNGKVLSREIGYFEHVNLLGNIIVFLVLGVVYFNLSMAYKILVFLMGMLSLSTGSMLLSALVFIPVRKITIRNLTVYSLLIALSVFLLYFCLYYFSPILHSKIFGIFTVFDSYSFSDFFALVETNTPLNQMDVEVKSSLVWRVYAWMKYYIAIVETSFNNIFFGHGTMSFLEVWGGVMPHNDFILILYDLGIVFYLMLIPTLYKFYCIAKNNKVILFIGVLFLLRLFVENVIYSQYTFTIFIIQLALIKTHYDKEKFVHNSHVSA